MSLSGLILKMDFRVRGALPGDGGSLEAGSSLRAGSLSLGKRRGRGERCQRSLSHLRDGPRLAACWPGQVLAPGLGDVGKGRRKAALRKPHARGAARVGPAGTEAVAAATPQRSPRGQPDTRPFFPFCLLPLPPASLPSARLTWRLGAGRRRRGGRGLRGAPGRLSRMLRNREPCSCHGRSSLCSAPAPAPVF